MMQNYALIVAGGSGARMQSELPKQFIELAGKPILMHTLEAFDFDDIQIILVLPQSQISYWKTLCIKHDFTINHKIVNGGNTRFQSVKNGLTSIETFDGLVAIHDGVRPLIKREVIVNSFQEANDRGNAVVSVPSKDSLRKISGPSNEAVKRADFKIIQTPQTFQVQLIKKAFETPYQESFTDDASVLESSGQAIYLIQGNYSNIKITTPEDLLMAESILKG